VWYRHQAALAPTKTPHLYVDPLIGRWKVVRELRHHDVRRSPRVLMAELEAHGPAAQISLIELFFRGILEIGAANDETVGRELRELSAEQIFVVEAESPPLRAQP
jgi:hypothetical protein